MSRSGPICVIGAGISGLAAAQELLDRGEDVVVIESSSRAGGAIRTSKVDGHLFEWGPNSFSSTASEILELAEKAGISQDIISAKESAETRLLYHRHHLRRIPTGPKELMKTDMFTLWQKLRILWEPFVAKRTSVGPESVAEFFSRRFGPAPTRTLVDAFVSGIYAGDARQVDIEATFPMLKQMENEFGSVIKAMKARSKKGGKEKITIKNFKEGLEELPLGLARNLGDRLKLNCKAKSLRSRVGGGFDLIIDGPDGTEELTAKQIVLAVPAQIAGLLLTGVNPIVADLLFDIDYAPIASVHAAFEDGELENLPEAFGFLVPRPSRMRTLGWLFNSMTFDGRAPEGVQCLNGFIGGSLDREVVKAQPDALKYILLGELSLALGMHSFPEPSYFKIINHEPGLPQYMVGHAKRVKAINTLLQDTPDLALIGNYLEGVSLNDCIKKAKSAVTQLVGETSRKSDKEEVA